MQRFWGVLATGAVFGILACGSSERPAPIKERAPALVQRSPFSGAPVQLPGRIEAENYDNGGEGVAYHDTSAGNVFGAYRGDDVDVGAIPAASGGGYHVGNIATGEWTTYSVNVPVQGRYQLRVRAASANAGPNTFHVEVGGVNLTGTVSVPSTGDWQTYTVLALPAVTLAAGTQVIKVAFDQGLWNFDYLEILRSAPYAGAPASLPGHVEAEAYDTGGEGVAYHDGTPGNAFGTYRFDDVDVGPIPGGGSFIGAIDPGEWVNYTVNLAATQSYELHVHYASAFPGSTSFHVELEGQIIGGSQSLASTGDWQAYQLKVIQLGTLSAGTSRQLRFVFDAGSWNFDWFELQAVQPQCVPPAVTAITTQPASGNALPHGSATLSATVSGTTPALQWLKDGNPITGANSSTLTITNADERAVGNYQLRATNACGSATSAKAFLNVPCDAEGPVLRVESMVDVLKGGAAVCNWRADYDATFPNALGPGSYNLPVLAAAIGFLEDANMPGPDNENNGIANWWRRYLQGELGDRGSQWYYGGKELFSGIYQQFNIVSVMAVHRHAHDLKLLDLEILARRWLRATFALLATSATSPLLTTVDRDVVCDGKVRASGPYLAVAGMRTAWPHWTAVDRPILYAHAVAEATNNASEEPNQQALRVLLETGFTGSSGHDIYGMLASEKVALAGIRNSGQLPDFFSSMIAGLKTIVPYHFVAWPGVRVTLMEGNSNHYTAPTYGVAWFGGPVNNLGGSEAFFLFPWNRGDDPANHCKSAVLGNGNTYRPWRSDITDGSATLDLPGQMISATNGPLAVPPSPLHPLTTVSVNNLPAGLPQYHVVLGP